MTGKCVMGYLWLSYMFLSDVWVLKASGNGVKWKIEVYQQGVDVPWWPWGKEGRGAASVACDFPCGGD